jgi:hypothetical protein
MKIATLSLADASQTRISAVMGPNYLRLADDELANYCSDQTCGDYSWVLCRQKFQLDAVIINVTGSEMMMSGNADIDQVHRN